MGQILDFGGDFYYLSDGAIVGITIAGVVIFILLPILCCLCCGLCCFAGRKKKNHQTQPTIFLHPPTQPGTRIVPAQNIAPQINNETPEVSSQVQQQWSNYPPQPYSYGQGHSNNGYANEQSQYQSPYYPESRFYPQQVEQYQSHQHQFGGYRQQAPGNRVPRNYLGQTSYDIYGPQRVDAKLPRPAVIKP